MGTSNYLRHCALCAPLLWAVGLPAQTSTVSSGRTVRHHQVQVEDQSQPPELIKAEAAIERKDYAAAELLLRKVVASQPTSYQAWFDLGFVYNALGKPEDSITAYRKSVKAKPDVFESNLILGLMLVKNKQPGAAEYLRAATRLKPTSHVEQGHATAWLALAHVLEANDPNEAIEAYRQASAHQPKDSEPHLSAGQLLEAQNKFAEAEQQYDAAISELQAGLKMAPEDLAGRRDLAEVYANAGKHSEAEALYRSLVSAQPKDPEVHSQLGQTLMKLKKFGEAEQEFLAAVKLKPDWGAAYGDLAVAANENHDYPLAIKALDMRAKYLPEIPVGYFLRATAYDHLRKYHEAAANYHLFLQVANGNYPDQEWQARHRLITIEPKK